MYTAQGRIDQSSLLEEHLPAIRRQALALQVKLPAGIDLDDLIQAGILGLLEAFQRFDASEGASLATFASQRIRGAMIDELRSRDWLPRRVRRQARDVDACIHRLEQQLGRAPEENEIAREMGMELDEYRRLLTDTNNGYLLPLEEIIEERGEPSASATASPNPFNAAFEVERKEQLEQAIEALPEREKILLTLYYQEELNLKEIGAVLDISESRVCQIHSQALSRLRGRLGNYP